MKLSNYISNCRHRSIVTNSRGRALSVTCGNCPDCLARKARRLTNLCIQETSRNGYQFLITLKYNEFNVPRMAFTATYRNGVHYIDFYDITSRQVSRRFFGHEKIITYKVPEYQQRVQLLTLTDAEMPKFKQIYNKSNIHSKLFDNASLPQNFRYLRKKDLELFYKNLRSYIAETSSSPIKYYGAGEYGPKTFRPHFHILLSFNDPKIARHLEGNIAKAWKFGDFTCEQTDSSDKSAKYVASYLNSFTRLPYIFKDDNVKPFSTHSLHFGHVVNKDVREFAYKNTTRVSRTNLIRLPQLAIPILKTPSFDTTYFPRPYNYDNQTRQRLHSLYTCYQSISKLFPNCSTVAELTRCVLKYHHLYRSLIDFLDSLDIISYISTKYTHIQYPFIQLQNPDFYENLYPSTTSSHFEDLSELDQELEHTVYSRIYNALLLSKRFLSFNCEGRNVYDVIDIIQLYYQDRQHEMMRQFYEQQNNYVKLTGLSDFSIFYFNIPSYIDIYNSNVYIQNINSLKDAEYDRNIKHKTQNDANLIFVNQ